MRAFLLALCALALAGIAQARPVVVEETAILTPPDSSWKFFGGIGVAIDGDYALVTGERWVDDPSAEDGIRHEGAAFLYHRSGTSWNYAGLLGPVATIGDLILPGIAMKDGVAMVLFGSVRIFELSGTTWTQAPVAAGALDSLQGPDIEIDAGRILVPRYSCYYESVVLRKINGAWAIEGDLVGHSNRDCGPNIPSVLQDLQGDHAVMHNPVGFNGEPTRVRQYRLNANGVGWEEYGGVENGSIGNILGPDIAMSGSLLAVTGTRERGTTLVYELDPPAGAAAGAFADYGMQAADGYLAPDEPSATSIERVGTLFAQRNYSYNRKAYVINLFRVNDDHARSSEHVAALVTKQGTSVGTKLDASGRYIIVNGLFTVSSGEGTVRVYQLPATLDQPAVQVHDFETPSAGAAWQPTAGSTFSIATADNTHVYRQASTAGNPAAYLPTSAAGNQAIQSEVTVRASTGADAWVGLTTRRRDDSNYYYVTLRTTGSVELKRMVAGVSTSLGAASATVTTGRKYRLRLESVGTVHRVYLNDSLVLTARDSSLTDGTAGVMTNRAAADYDNVIVTPTPFTTIYKHSFTSSNPGIWYHDGSSTWQSNGGVFQPVNSLDYAEAYTGARTDDQIVQVRIRPTSFEGPDNWVGVVGRWQDSRNHLYVSLRNRGVISLWRRTNGSIQQLATARMTVATGTWYLVRLEIVGGLTRVFVNDHLMLSTSADPGPTNPNTVESKGRVGLITYRARADFDDFIAYQP